MDPNQDNQGSDAAGANRQAVFTPQTEPVPPTGNVDAPAQPTVNLSHPYLSNHPTQTFNTDTGDIILNTGPQKPKLNKRPFIIGGVILAILIIVILITIALFKGNNINDLRNNFKKYASYLLTQDVNDASWIEVNQADDYMSMEGYALYRQFYSSSHSEYFTELTKLFDKFITDYRSAKDKLNTETTIIIEQYIQNYKLLDAISKTPQINNETLQSIFFDQGQSGVKTWVDNSFFSLSKVNEDGVAYFTTINEYSQAYADILSYYQEKGCLDKNGIDSSCAESYAPDVDNQDNYTKADNAFASLTLTQAFLIDNLQQNCWVIIELIGENNA